MNTYCGKHKLQIVWRLNDILNFRCAHCKASVAVSRSKLHATTLGLSLVTPLQSISLPSQPRAVGYIKGNARRA